MGKKNLLLKLQRRYEKGGYALVSEVSGRVFAFGNDIRSLYRDIEDKKVKDEDKTVVYIPSASVKHVF